MCRRLLVFWFVSTRIYLNLQYELLGYYTIFQPDYLLGSLKYHSCNRNSWSHCTEMHHCCQEISDKSNKQLIAVITWFVLGWSHYLYHTGMWERLYSDLRVCFSFAIHFHAQLTNVSVFIKEVGMERLNHGRLW